MALLGVWDQGRAAPPDAPPALQQHSHHVRLLALRAIRKSNPAANPDRPIAYRSLDAELYRTILADAPLLLAEYVLMVVFLFFVISAQHKRSLACAMHGAVRVAHGP
jgi:hypothetical protein